VIQQGKRMGARVVGANHEGFESLPSRAGCWDAQFVLVKILSVLRSNAEGERKQREQDESYRHESSLRYETPMRDFRRVSCYKTPLGFHWQHDADDSKTCFLRILVLPNARKLAGASQSGFLELFFGVSWQHADAEIKFNSRIQLCYH
jgi:hypothetical protein